jgi:hypothetical protein
MTTDQVNKKEDRFQEGDSIFDGFMHRPFNPDTDGWRNELLVREDVPSVQIARDVIMLFNEVNALRKEVWRLRKIEKRYNEYLDGYVKNN